MTAPAASSGGASRSGPNQLPEDPDEGTPEGYAFILSVNLMELVDLPASLPGSDPDARAITWIVNSVPGTK